MEKKSSVAAVIVAAGVGQRFGQDKLLLQLDQHTTVLEKSLAAFDLPIIDEIIVVCHQSTLATYQALVQKNSPNNSKLKFIVGGTERWQSSLLGIQATNTDYVAIHDAARPLIKPALIEQAIEAAYLHQAALVAAPATDSIKLVNQDLENVDALDRSTIWLAQTPQVFAKDLILEAYQLAQTANYHRMTDESELITRFLKRPVKIIPSDNQNLKITFPLDLKFAQTILAQNT